MTAGFVGRVTELAVLHKRLERVRTSGDGAALTLRGRRQIGKSRLIQEFCDRAGVPYLFFTAIKGESPVESVNRFGRDLRESALPADPELVPVVESGNWSEAFRALASALPAGPAIVVIDELPWLAEQDDLFDGALQAAWDRQLRPRPVLLLLLGSDLHMMDRLTAYDRPFFGRADHLTLGPLNPAEVGRALDLAADDAVDARLVSGGLPGILNSWPAAMPALDFLAQESEDPASPLFSTPESALLAEFPTPDLARRALEAIGSGERTHAGIAAAAGGRSGPLPSGSLSPLLRQLVNDKQVIDVEEPLSTRPGKPSLYRVADSNLRLYLAILRDAQELARRGRPRPAYQLIQQRWPAWRGRAVEPLVREAVARAAADGDLPWPRAHAVGGWWNRRFDPEVDLVGADRGPVAHRVDFAGSIKWLGTPFDAHDLSALARDAAQVPGFDPGSAGLLVVSRSGITADSDRVDAGWGPADVVARWEATCR